MAPIGKLKVVATSKRAETTNSSAFKRGGSGFSLEEEEKEEEDVVEKGLEGGGLKWKGVINTFTELPQ